MPDCPNSIVEMRSYRNNIKVTYSTDQKAQEIPMDNAIIEFNTHATLYLKLSYNKMLSLADALTEMIAGKIDRFG